MIKMKKSIKKLELNKTTVVVLTENQKSRIIGGLDTTPLDTDKFPSGGIKRTTSLKTTV